jgi:hypothetical protein
MYCPWHFGIGGNDGFGLLEKELQKQSKTKTKKQEVSFPACDRTTAASTSSTNVLSIT